MAKVGGEVSELVRCAEAVEREVRRLEELSRAARRIRLTSEKNITRAARELQEAMEQQERLARELRTFGEAMGQMQSRQQSAVEPLSIRATEIQERVNRLSDHMQRFGALGVRANEMAVALREVSDGSAPEALGTSRDAERASALIDVDDRFRVLVDDAKALADSAESE